MVLSVGFMFSAILGTIPCSLEDVSKDSTFVLVPAKRFAFAYTEANVFELGSMSRSTIANFASSQHSYS